VPEGHEGVLTFSHIDFRGTVLIRYYTGDLIKGVVWNKCEHCGHTGPRLLTPLCRAVKDFTKIKGSRVNLLDLQTAIRSTAGVESFHVVITKEKADDPFSRDWVRVHVVKKADATEESIVPAMKKNVKLDCEISPSEIVFNAPEEVERMLFARTNLKADWIVDERQVHA
jgi:phenylacetate-coenzyme A ligase PaaK-like adenylate-forming protein